MSYQALARKWRPQTFRDVIGQDTVVRTLKNAIEQKRIHHAYLFSGVRGVGKTTAARIFAKAINCVHGPTPEPCNECSICREITEGIDMDVREIDAATYTGVDNIRELRDVTQFQPARDRKRIFIIDEAHMLSTPAWNALLKLIEEPPPHMLFMFATTEMHKIPATILSRVQSFALRKITEADVARRLAEICQSEGIEAEPAALSLIARRGEGSVRDSLSILDQIIAFSGKIIRFADVSAVLGLSGAAFFSRLMAEIEAGSSPALLDLLEEASENGRDFKLLYRDLLHFLRNALFLAAGARESLLTLPEDDLAVAREVAGRFSESELLRILNLLMQDEEIVTRSEQQRLAVEIVLLKAATLPRLRAVESVIGSQGGSPPPRRDSARRSEAAAAAPRSEKPAPSSTAATAPAAPVASASITDRVGAQRHLAGGHLAQAARSRTEGDEVIFEFEPGSGFALEYLSAPDQLGFLCQIASEVHGRPMKVRLTTPAAVSGAVPGRNEPLLSEDPVIRSFSKHLGGEIIPARTTRKSEKS
jgi:DNA polymerase-3 subunit gamma/tau